MVLYGKALVTQTPSLLGPEASNKTLRYAGNNLTCQNCHLVGGTQRFGLPLTGVYATFPTYMAREDEVRTLEDRVNGCMERSMNGRVLPIGGKEMKAMVAYIQFLSTGVPVGKSPEGRGSPNLPLLARAAEALDVSRGMSIVAIALLAGRHAGAIAVPGRAHLLRSNAQGSLDHVAAPAGSAPHLSERAALAESEAVLVRRIRRPLRERRHARRGHDRACAKYQHG